MDDILAYSRTFTSDQENAIRSEFRRLQDECYLEHAGATLYSEKQIENATSQLLSSLYTNTHGKNVSSKATEDAIDVARYDILAHFNTNPEEYSVVFTSGATASLKLIAECFHYGNEGSMVYLQDNHTSVLGMRQYPKTSHCLTMDRLHLLNTCCECKPSSNNSLFVYPAQSNFSGRKYPLKWCENVQKGTLNNSLVTKTSSKWYVVLDASSYVATNQLDLSAIKPDFVAISFYKIFGYPTGLGALLIRQSSAHVLHKKYFGGGTIRMAQSTSRSVVLRDVIHERFEDGSLNFLSIVCLRHGFDTILKRFQLTFDTISQHTFNLAKYVYWHLVTLHHSNGQPAAVVYQNSDYFQDRSVQGGIVNFNLVRDNGDYIGYAEVMHFANLHGIHLRTGCSCNPGACQYFLRLTPEDVQKHFQAGHVCDDQQDLIDGSPTGSVRISFGYMSTKQDADTLLRMIEECFLTKPIVRKIPTELQEQRNLAIVESNGNKNHDKGTKEEYVAGGVLELIFLYPVKSCGAFSVDGWPITSTGLKFDRLWMVVNASGVCMTQKHNKKMCLIVPFIDLHSEILTLTFPGQYKVEIPIEENEEAYLNNKSVFLCQSKICNDAIQGLDCGDKVAEWLSSVLETPGLRLLKQHFGTRTSKNDEAELSLVNQAQYLLINTASLQWLKDRISDIDFTESIEYMGKRFRPNLIVRFSTPFVEMEMLQVSFESLNFKVTGKCTRCQMICIDQNTGRTSKEPLRTLAKEFKGKINFGIYLSRLHAGKEEYLTVGNAVISD